MTCNKALRVVTDDGETLLPCVTGDAAPPFHLHDEVQYGPDEWRDQHETGNGIKWCSPHPAEVTVEPEQPTVTEDEMVALVNNALGTKLAEHDAEKLRVWFRARGVDVLPSDVAGEQPPDVLTVDQWRGLMEDVFVHNEWDVRDQHGSVPSRFVVDAFVDAGLAGHQPQPTVESVEAWKAQAVEVMAGCRSTGRLMWSSLADALVDAGLAPQPAAPPFDKAEAVEWLMSRKVNTQQRSGGDYHAPLTNVFGGTSGFLDRDFAEAIVAYFKKAAGPVAAPPRLTHDVLVGAMAHVPIVTTEPEVNDGIRPPTRGELDRLADAVMALVEPAEEDDDTQPL